MLLVVQYIDLDFFFRLASKTVREQIIEWMRFLLKEITQMFFRPRWIISYNEWRHGQGSQNLAWPCIQIFKTVKVFLVSTEKANKI